MADVIIENPILNSPFKEPARHFKFSDDGITNEIVEVRRVSSYFVPIANTQDIKEGITREEINAATARRADTEILYDQPYEDNKRIRVT